MNKHPRSIWLVLIASVQLVVLLASLMLLFNWLSVETHRISEQQILLQNANLCEKFGQTLKAIDQQEFYQKTDAVRKQKIAKVIESGPIVKGQFVGLFDAGSGEPWGWRSEVSAAVGEEIVPWAIWNSPVESIEPIPQQGLIKTLVKNSQKHILAKQSTVDKRHHLIVQAKYYPQLNAVLVVGQHPLYTLTGLQWHLDQSQQVAFSIALIIGLIGICLTVFIANRVGQAVGNLTDVLEKAVNESASELIKTKNAVIFGLAKLAESRDNDTGEHLDRIRLYVTILARDLAESREDFDNQFIHDIGLASSLHDIGKVGIPDSILLKPGKLTAEERGIMEIHTLIGGDCLDAIQARLGDNEFMSIARQIAYYHHERWDGTGYPHALRGNEIPLVARIVAVADVYDALTSKRPYKNAMTHKDSRDIIVAGCGKHFDPEIVGAFLRHEEEFEAISIRQQSLSDDEVTSNFQRLCEAAAS